MECGLNSAAVYELVIHSGLFRRCVGWEEIVEDVEDFLGWDGYAEIFDLLG